MSSRTDIDLLHLLGEPLLAIRPQGKAPVRTGWKKHSITDAELEKTNRFGIKLGGEAGLVDIEGDGPAADSVWDMLADGLDLPKTLEWKSARGKHRVFRITPETRAIIGDTPGFTHDDLEFRLGKPTEYSMYSIIPNECDEREWTIKPTQAPPADLPVELARRIAGLKSSAPTPRVPHTNDEPVDTTTPGYQYGEKHEWSDLLTNDGWTYVGSRNEGTTDWMRPGGTQLSATVGYSGDDRLYVFSDNAGLPKGQNLTKFGYYGWTHHAGDFGAAAAALRAQGYGDSASASVDPLAMFDDLETETAAASSNKILAEAGAPLLTAEQIVVPGFIENFVKLCKVATHRSDPVAAAAVGFSALSLMMGRTVKTVDGGRPNLGVLLLGDTGSGKTQAMKQLRKVFDAAGLGYNVFSSFKSREALEDTVADTPNLLYLAEEFHDKLRHVVEGRHANPHQQAIYSCLKDLMTASDDSYTTRCGTASTTGKGERVDQPSISMLFSGIANEFWENMTPQLMRGGFLGRLWVVELNGLAPKNWEPAEAPDIFEKLRDHALKWRVAAENLVLADPTSETGRALPLNVPAIGRTEESRTLALEYAHEIEDNAQEASKNKDDSQGAWNRASEFFGTLELLIAGSRGYSEDMEITADDTRRAIKLAKASIQATAVSSQQVRQVDENIEKGIRAIIRFLERRADGGDYVITRRHLLQGVRGVNARLLNDILVDAIPRQVLVSDTLLKPCQSQVATAGNYICLPEYADRLVKRTRKGKQNDIQ